MVILLKKRVDIATEVQNVLTSYGCIITVRMGIHETVDDCKKEGVITLFLNGEKKEIKALEKELLEIEDVKANMMRLDF
jgi:metal-responsive CopG/Arc/MetJ family transcriptional regulator